MELIVISAKDKKYLPRKQTKGAFAYDLSSRVNDTIEPWEIKLIPTGIKVRLPEDVWMLVYPRSSLPIKKGLIMANSVWIIDSDYRGEVHLQLMNVTWNPIDIVDGERYGQAVFQGGELPYMIDEELDSFDTFEEKYPTERGTGGFWSTGK